MFRDFAKSHIDLISKDDFHYNGIEIKGPNLRCSFLDSAFITGMPDITRINGQWVDAIDSFFNDTIQRLLSSCYCHESGEKMVAFYQEFRPDLVNITKMVVRFKSISDKRPVAIRRDENIRKITQELLDEIKAEEG